MTVRIGIVEDHPVVVDGLRAALSAEQGFEIAARAGTIRDAEVLLTNEGLDVILMDVRLPDGNGLELLERTDGARSAAVIVLSSFATAQYVAAAVRFGAMGFLLKTAPLDEVAAAVRRVAAGGSAFSAEQLREGLKGPVRLRPRERDVVRRILAGQSNDEIAAGLRTSRKAVEHVLSRLFARFDVANRLELGLRAEREAWLDIEPR
ncbi:MAG: response regulator transcription factor [Chloroflexota bacterium]